MQIFFATLTKVETFKWELDIAVQRKGLAPIPVRDDQMEPPGALEIADPFANGDFGVRHTIHASLTDLNALPTVWSTRCKPWRASIMY